MPQIVLNVPPEVIRLLTGIQSSLQRIEQELREIKQRIAWTRPATVAERPSAPSLPRPIVVPVREEPSIPAPRPKHFRSDSHTPKGPAAARRMLALLVRTGLSGVKLAHKLDTHQTTVSMVARGKLGISRRLHEAMGRLEGAK